MRNWNWLWNRAWYRAEQYCATCDTYGGGHKPWCPLA